MANPHFPYGMVPDMLLQAVGPLSGHAAAEKLPPQKR